MNKQAFNPYLPQWEYVPDGEPRVFGGRLYVFGSHDRFDGDRYCLNDYVSWSAPLDDLSEWRYDGVIYRAVQDPHNTDGAMRLFAPDVVQGPDGRYYLYYALSSRNAVSVAVSDVPNGAYTFLSDICHADGTVLGEKPGDRFQFDPGVLVDDDGRIYLYTGFSPDGELLASMRHHFGACVSGAGSCVTELEPDMKTVKTPSKPLIPGWQNARGTGFEGREFFEASSIRKFGGTYYFVYSSARQHELCYAVSTYPDRDFRYRGVLHSNADATTADATTDPTENHGADSPFGAKYYWGNNHGSIVEINGGYFVFGHRQTNAHEFSRQGIAEKLTEDGNGGFIRAEMTSCGLNGKPLAGRGRYGAGIACHLQSASGACRITDASKAHPFITQNAPDYDPDTPNPGFGGANDAPWQYIRNMQDGSSAGFKYFALEHPRAIHVEIRGTAQGELVCGFTRKGAHGAEAAAPIAVSASEQWRTFSAKAPAPDGVYALTFTYHGKGSLDFKSFTLE